MSSLLLFGADITQDWRLPLVIGVGVGVAFLVGIVALLIKQYRRCPPNRILVVCGYGRRGEPSLCMHGGYRWIIPL